MVSKRSLKYSAAIFFRRSFKAVIGRRAYVLGMVANAANGFKTLPQLNETPVQTIRSTLVRKHRYRAFVLRCLGVCEIVSLWRRKSRGLAAKMSPSIALNSRVTRLPTSCLCNEPGVIGRSVQLMDIPVFFRLTFKRSAQACRKFFVPPPIPNEISERLVSVGELVVNLRDRPNQRFLKSLCVLELDSATSSKEVKERLMAIRYELNLLLSGQSFDNIRTTAEVEQLRTQMVKRANKRLSGNRVKNVWIQEWVTQ